MTPQQTKIVSYLSLGKYSVYELLMRGCGYESRKRISELRKMGYTIKDVWEKQGRLRFKKYFIEEK